MIHIIGKSTKSCITNIHNECVQPNAVDLKILKLYEFDSTAFVLSNNIQHIPQTEMVPMNNFFTCCKGCAYGIVFDHQIKIGDDEAGFIITRSSLNRNGIFVQSGLYDSGFNNYVGGTMYCFNDCQIEVGSRIAQFVLFKSESLSLYRGQYQGK